MSVEVRWHGAAMMDGMQRRLETAIRRGTLLLHARARLLASRPAKRIRRQRKRSTSAGKRGSQYTVFVPSAPNSPPALRTGFGRSNVTFELLDRGLEGRVGVTRQAAYMAYLELGTRRIAPRPWLKPAMDQARDAVLAMLRAAARLP